MTTATLASVHRRFEAALPVIRQSARYALRRRRHDRDDLLAEIIACAWKAWRGLVERGRNPMAVGVTGIAAWAARHALKGRRIGNRGGGRGAMDIFHRRAQAIGSFRVDSYDSGPATPTELGDRVLEGMARRRPPRQPRRRGVLPARFRRLARAPARTATEDGRVAHPGPRDPRGCPVRRDHAGGREPGPLMAGAKLAGIPGRNPGRRPSTLPSVMPEFTGEGDAIVRPGPDSVPRRRSRTNPSHHPRSMTRRRSPPRWCSPPAGGQPAGGPHHLREGRRPRRPPNPFDLNPRSCWRSGVASRSIDKVAPPTTAGTDLVPGGQTPCRGISSAVVRPFVIPIPYHSTPYPVAG